MFSISILIGIYSYLILFLGILGILKIIPILIITLFYTAGAFVYFYNRGSFSLAQIELLKQIKNIYFFLLLILIQAFVNLIGVFGPELSFDTLWYHLTLPKLYILNSSVFHIPGGLLYYSSMPKLTEMLYVVGLVIGDERIPKLIHFGFGILSCIAIYKISRKFLNSMFSILGVVIFYSSLIVGWQSITAYIDLSRTFFEIMALWGFLNFIEKKEKKWLIESAVMLGLAISTKLIAFGSLIIFLIIIGWALHRSRYRVKEIFYNLTLFIFISLLIPSPWFFLSWINTGNFFYPIFTKVYSLNINLLDLLNPINFVKEIFLLFARSADSISPIYLIFIPLILYYFHKLSIPGKIIAVYCLISIFVWYITPRTGGGRFILPYLPAFSILAMIILSKVKNKMIYKYLVTLIILISVSSIGYRMVANFKYIPVILGQQAKSEFLKENLNFSFGDFYDIDSYFRNNIKKADTVLLYGFHNLYYVNFSFIDSSWVKKGDEFNYIAAQNSEIPERFSDWNMIYYNSGTKVKLYTKGGIRWVY